MAKRSHMCPFGDDPAAALLDEEFDELCCEPGVLLRLANQAWTPFCIRRPVVRTASTSTTP